GPAFRIKLVRVRSETVFPYVEELVAVRVGLRSCDGRIAGVGTKVSGLPHIVSGGAGAPDEAENRKGVLSSHIDLAVGDGWDGKFDAVGQSVSAAGCLRAVENFAGQVRRIVSDQHAWGAHLQRPNDSIAGAVGRYTGSCPRITIPPRTDRACPGEHSVGDRKCRQHIS